MGAGFPLDDMAKEPDCSIKPIKRIANLCAKLLSISIIPETCDGPHNQLLAFGLINSMC